MSHVLLDSSKKNLIEKLHNCLNVRERKAVIGYLITGLNFTLCSLEFIQKIIHKRFKREKKKTEEIGIKVVT